jgi:hypothetical protein
MQNSNSDKAKREAILKLQDGRRLTELGGSLFITIPKMWARLYAWQIDGSYWAQVKSVGNQLIISPIDKKKALEMMEANNVRTTEIS